MADGKVKPEDPAKLTDFRLLSFDVYSTLIDEKGGFFTGLQPLLSRLAVPNPYVDNKVLTLTEFQKFEKQLQISQPGLKYNELLPKAYKLFAEFLGLSPPIDSEASAFGDSIGSWPAFPDTVAALRTLKKYYKLVILSNVDNDSISKTLEGPLGGVDFDAVYTAQEIGSYKPDLNNFAFLVQGVARDLGVDKREILHTAQSLTHDCVPAKQMRMANAWISRENADDKLQELRNELDFTWRFNSMGEMAECVEKEFRALK